jgi:hypothetical protein
LGDLDFKEPARFVESEPDVTRLALQAHKDTFVILGSDGLWDVLSDTDAVSTAAAALKVGERHRNGCLGAGGVLKVPCRPTVTMCHSGLRRAVGRSK